jgi:hypothetical protein
MQRLKLSYFKILSWDLVGSIRVNYCKPNWNNQCTIYETEAIQVYHFCNFLIAIWLKKQSSLIFFMYTFCNVLNSICIL